MSADAPLIIAVPSKGRLQENAAAFFSRAGLELHRPGGARDYRGAIRGLPGVEVMFLSASEIVTQLASGAAHLGITGEDLVREQAPDADEAMELLTPLGFGNANVVVAVPQAWIDVRTMADLDDVASEMRARTGERMRVATKYVNLTRSFFAAHGLADYRIVESLGATEGAPAAGSAEIIVDITTTGATLAANDLKVLDDGVILRSWANLVASLRAPWGPAARQAAAAILTRINAEETARASREVTALAPGHDAEALAALAARFGASLPWGAPVAGGPATLLCPAEQTFALAEALSAAGADHVSVRRVDYVFRRHNPLADRLFARLGR
ncbi:ATP phosphoribosyltransferase [Camelimonas abortus]|uniref:ATP phosphoribosyltransferase n=1 Tax=Camelimonas abortus TaxID=1017184 RepID=A0ABV7LGL4_9HYPH